MAVISFSGNLPMSTETSRSGGRRFVVKIIEPRDPRQLPDTGNPTHTEVISAMNLSDVQREAERWMQVGFWVYDERGVVLKSPRYIDQISITEAS